MKEQKSEVSKQELSNRLIILFLGIFFGLIFGIIIGISISNEPSIDTRITLAEDRLDAYEAGYIEGRDDAYLKYYYEIQGLLTRVIRLEYQIPIFRDTIIIEEIYVKTKQP